MDLFYESGIIIIILSSHSHAALVLVRSQAVQDPVS